MTIPSHRTSFNASTPNDSGPPSRTTPVIRLEGSLRAALRLAAFVILLSWPTAEARAQTRPMPRDLATASLEDLLNITITSAGRKEQRALETPSAVYVITQNDIRRSGMTSVPDLLRLAPGVDVAQINSNKWAVSVRGFNSMYSNKLLVLIDGRSVYNRLFSGVLWDAEDLMLDDIERIEVIRGPGAAMWGANAVNGVINIITKTAAETQGGLVRIEGGRAGEQGGVRYGGSLGAAHYRLYSQWTRRSQSLIAPATLASDASHSLTTGFRADWDAEADAFAMEANFTAGQARALWPNLDAQTAVRDPLEHDPTDTLGGHALGRWTHKRASGDSLQIQSFVDFADRSEPLGSYFRHVFNVDMQYHAARGANQDLVVGAGYGFIGESFHGRTGLSLTPADDDSSLLTGFAQDDISFFGKRLSVTIGTQLQYDSRAGAGVQPTARVTWKGLPGQRLWAATSRALRTPSLQDQGIRFDFLPVPTSSGLPLVVSLVGNPSAETESLTDVEAGYRLQIGGAASIDITGFVGRYEHLQTQEPAAPIVQLIPSPMVLVNTHFDNLLAATTRGLEIAGRWEPTGSWSLGGSYTAFHLTPDLASTSVDAGAATTDANAPGAQWQLRSTYTPIARASLNLAIFHVGRLEQLGVASYTRADVTGEWRLTKNLSAMAIGHNLLEAAHREFATTSSLLLATQVARSASLRLVWRGP